MWHICDLIIILPVLSLPILPNFVGVALHINESKARDMLYKHVPKYLVDQKKYLYVILLYIDALLCIGGLTLVGTALMIFAYFKHICGMIRIAR